MNTCSKNITSNRSPSDFSLISINLVREYIHLDFKNTDDRIINDFIALTFLIGNDFLPNFPLQGFDFSIILDSYKQLFSGTNQYLVNDTKEGFNLTNLGKFLLELSKLQNTTQPQCDPSYVLEAFYFVFIYYKSLGVPSWEWEYPFQHTPSLSAVSEYVLSLPHDFQPHFEIGSPLLPFEQLVAVLPPKFSQLVPKCLQCSLVDADEVKLFDVREIVRTKSEFFTKEENERNKFAKNMLFDNGNITEFNLENLPNVFDDVVNLAFVPSLKSIGKVSARIEYGVVVIKNKIQCDLWSDKK
ncbi:XRN 5'-3' exonuclease N-terminus family protein [Histomonas meleagridis]|uniref:XRN 5'-3' exonuclease N-terminus family protein n=1 Tax=Histomonas meleagridis TaxID=135588 RepID=UPI0035597D11|nr:XRN 5'-3' exonuclease N-terminus family protein [Histomonas meleagridis]